MELRPYQQAAVDAVYNYLREHDDNPCIVIPTAGGKTPIMATICKDAVTQWNGRVLILAHVKELLEQATGKLQAVCPEIMVGIYSAGLGRRDTLASVIVAGIQSVYRKASELGHFELVLVDEAHLIPSEGDGMYRTLLADLKKINPKLRVIGLTATPYRMGTGSICGPDNILNSICYEIGVRELINDGYLCPLISKAGQAKADFDSLHQRAGEYVSSEVEALMDDSKLVDTACNEIVRYANERRSVLIFASGVKHAEHVAVTLRDWGKTVATIFGDTLDFEREKAIEDFKKGELKYLVNVNVLTTGFDAPNIDCIALLRPTLSPGLFYQMVGRGFRRDPKKKNCLILDYGGNVLRHGPVDAVKIKSASGKADGVAPIKECVRCHSIIAAGYAICPDCGFEFPKPKAKHDATATTAGVITGQTRDQTYTVESVQYYFHQKRSDPNAPPTMRVEYRVGLAHYANEWVCLQHVGFAKAKANVWWAQRSNAPIPESIDEALAMADAGALAKPKTITVRTVAGDKFKKILRCELEPKPEWHGVIAAPPEPEYVPVDDSIPF